MKSLLKYYSVCELSGDIVKVVVANDTGTVKPKLEDLASVIDSNGDSTLAQIISIDGDIVTLQVYGGTKGINMKAGIVFLGHPLSVKFSKNILGRTFRGNGIPIDNGPNLDNEPEIPINTISVNPVQRLVPHNLVRTNIPMIDVFNCLVESQKIPVFAKAGEPYNLLLEKIAVETDADVVIFGGMGMMFDDYHIFRKAFEDAGVFSRTIMFVNLGNDPVVERLLVPDLALSVAERFAVDEGKKVLVLLTDMTSFADALKEIGISMEKIPSNRGYIGDLYSQLARRYEKACSYKGAGSLTLLTTTTMPGGDVTHPVPDNTGYITEGQFYLRNGSIDPFGSLSRLKQHVIGDKTREDHGQVANTLIRLYSESQDAVQKQAMAFDLSDYDERLIKFGRKFEEKFMDLSVVSKLEDSLNAGWELMQSLFSNDELLVKKELIEKYGVKK